MSRELVREALNSRRRDLVLASVLYSTHQLGESLVPVIVGAAIGQAVASGGPQDLVVWLVLLGADFVFLSMSYRFGARASMRAKQHTGHYLRVRLAERVLRPTGGADRSPGELLSRASSDAGQVGAYAGVVAMTVASSVVLAASTILLLRYSLLLGAIIVGGTLLLVVVQRRVAAVLRGRSTVEQGRQAQATELAEDLLRGLRVLVGIGAQHRAAARYARVSREAVTAATHSASSQAGLSAVSTLLGGLYLTAVAGVGGWLALSGDLGVGEYVASLGLAQFLIMPMRMLANAGAARARALASAGRLQEILDSPPAVAEPAAPVAPRGPGAVRLTGFDVDVPAGSLTGLACADPATAAEVVALLGREHTGSPVLLDGVDLGDLALADLRAAVLVAPHDPVLFPETIADNVADPEAARVAFADQVIATRGATASVGDRGETLSGGQRQRVALARALAADPPVLVLHDPTTSVDAATEDLVAERVRQARAGRTTVVVTTSPAWLSRCDQVHHLGAEHRVDTHDRLLGQADYARTVAR